ncbi:MAG: DUF2330 domain-containing protein [Myxococcales bacterium]|nr:DUF2330 domain-containing protein [Myxococcales bacterium]
MRRLASLALPSLALAASLLLAPRDAEACTAVFYPISEPVDGGPAQSLSVVSDHRMAIAITPSMTTIWDQVNYIGDPAEFAWVLPVRGLAVVGIGSDNFLASLDKSTAVRVETPKAVCDYGYGGYDYNSDYRSGCGCSGYQEDYASSGGSYEPDVGTDDGVVVTKRSTVGPYEVAQLHSSDPDVLVRWLSKNKYAIPGDIAPILAKFTSEGFDFVVVRLRPGFGIKAMRPIRVSTRGASPQLPLRMAAAGISGHVGMQLFVIGEGRFRTKNFPTFSVDPGQLVWDYKAGKSNYVDLRDAAAKVYDGRAWALESSVDVAQSMILAPEAPPTEPPFDAGIDASPSTDTGATDTAPADTLTAADTFTATDAADAASDAIDADPDAATDATPDALPATDSGAIPATDTGTKPSDTGADLGAPPGVSPTASDVEIAFGTYTYRRVTRLRADLPVRHLSADLELEVDSNQAQLKTVMQSTAWVHGENVCPGGTLRGLSTPATLLGPSKAGAACAMPQESAPDYAMPIGLTLGLVGLGLVRRRRVTSR